MKRLTTLVISCIFAVLLLSGCYDFINVTDRGSDSYLGWPVYDNPSLMELVSPVDEAEILYYRSEYELVCSEIIDAALYTFQVAEDEAFSTVVLEGTPSENSFTINPSSLTEGATYYWRARASSGDYCEPLSFTVKEPGVGDFMEGGIVFYIDTDTWKGLVAAEEDLGRAVWGRTDYQIGAMDYYGGVAPQRTYIFDGAGNTEAIVNALGDLEVDYAAKLCANLELNGYTDWFLPSMNELITMKTALHWLGIGDFVEAWYWSSTEQDGESASAVDFGYSEYNSSGWDKDRKYRVRAVRMFDYSENFDGGM